MDEAQNVLQPGLSKPIIEARLNTFDRWVKMVLDDPFSEVITVDELAAYLKKKEFKEKEHALFWRTIESLSTQYKQKLAKEEEDKK